MISRDYGSDECIVIARDYGSDECIVIAPGYGSDECISDSVNEILSVRIAPVSFPSLSELFNL